MQDHVLCSEKKNQPRFLMEIHQAAELDSHLVWLAFVSPAEVKICLNNENFEEFVKTMVFTIFFTILPLILRMDTPKTFGPIPTQQTCRSRRDQDCKRQFPNDQIRQMR